LIPGFLVSPDLPHFVGPVLMRGFHSPVLQRALASAA
jgi:hypothetical protein